MGITACEAVRAIRQLTEATKEKERIAGTLTPEETRQFVEDIDKILEEADASLPMHFRR
jgi:hypothetical protein